MTKLAECQAKDIANMVLITGAPRSGTTIFGKIVSTLNRIEYQFEPPTFYLLSSLYASSELNIKQTVKLMRVFLYEDLLLESIHGRNVNLRPNDDGLILNSKHWKEINQRWSEIKNRADAMQVIADGKARLAVKMPNVMDAIPAIVEAAPQCQIMLVVRDGRQVVRSIIEKRWVSQKALESELYPYYDQEDEVNVPYWVDFNDVNAWVGWNEATRACYMWRTHAELAWKLSKKNNASEQLKVFRYDELLKDPAGVVKSICDFLDESPTQFTDARVNEIATPKSMRSAPLNDFYEQVDPGELKKFVAVNERWGYFD